MTSSQVSVPHEFKSLWKLGGLSSGQLSRIVFKEIVKNDAFGRSAELAFYFLFAIFSLILLMMTAFGLFASHRAELQNGLLAYFADFLPPTAFQLFKKGAAPCRNRQLRVDWAA